MEFTPVETVSPPEENWGSCPRRTDTSLGICFRIVNRFTADRADRAAILPAPPLAVLPEPRR